MVWMLSMGFIVNFGVDPAARLTAMVSPIAREKAKIADLTPREREIIRSLVLFEASTNEEIASHLYIGKSTLKNHLTTIYSKLELRNRIELLKYALTHKLAETNK